MILSMLAEILQLIERTAAQQLTQEQKQPIDLLLLIRNHRLRAILLITELARGQHGIHPHTGRPVVHATLILSNEPPHFVKLVPQVIPHLVLLLTFLALHLPGDGRYLLGQQVVQVVHRGTVSRGPGV